MCKVSASLRSVRNRHPTDVLSIRNEGFRELERACTLCSDLRLTVFVSISFWMPARVFAIILSSEDVRHTRHYYLTAVLNTSSLVWKFSMLGNRDIKSTHPKVGRMGASFALSIV